MQHMIYDLSSKNEIMKLIRKNSFGSHLELRQNNPVLIIVFIIFKYYL